MKTILNRLYQSEYLSQSEAKNILIQIATGTYNPIQVAAFLSIYNFRNPCLDELKGFRAGMLDICNPVTLPGYDAIDVCGTGGDGRNTFNISTISAFIIAGAGIPVAKHGNYGVSSVSGSSDVVEYSGIRFMKNEEGLCKQMDAANMCFIHAPYFHPGMRAIAPVRQQLAVRTFFNMLGPLSNPVQPRYQMTGVNSLALLRMYQYIFQDEGKHFSLVHTIDGYDEVSLTSDFKYANNEGEFFISKNELTELSISHQDLFGGATVKDAAAILLNVLHGRGTPAQHEVVIINSAIAIRTCYPKLSLSEAKEKAAASLFNGCALKVLNQLKSIQ